ncbi:MAG: flagellar assembly peptidoglycan hydrolase FlgJ [Burkholderiales bacterium]|nr:flagellar assembly peptidoglycan hydrolase FlgJ [Burkholderiales bacterium]
MAAIPTTLQNATRTGFGDARGVESLRRQAAADPKTAVREAAKQFESLFMQELLKTMRQASEPGKDGSLDNEGTQLGRDMLDAQWAAKVAGRPGGLSDVIARQLERNMGLQPGPIPRPDTSSPVISQAQPSGIPTRSAADFVARHTESAKAAEASTGIPATFMVAQAAHESGWGKKEMKAADGSNTFNLFGIKASPNWKGATADVVTTEYINGTPRKVVQKFRAYSSYAESFADYASLMKNSPRYAKVVAAGTDAKGFAQGLQNAGYATDPAYASKLGKMINTTLRLQRSLSA